MKIALNIYKDVCLEEYERGVLRKPIEQFYIEKDNLLECIRIIKNSPLGFLSMKYINTLQDFLETDNIDLNEIVFNIAKENNYNIYSNIIEDIEL